MSCKIRMFRRSKGMILALVATAGLAVAALAIGCGGPHARFMTPERMEKMVTWHVDDVLDDLEVDDAQRTAVHALKAKLLAEARGLHDGGKDAHRALLAAWSAEAPDTAKMKALVDARLEAARAVAYAAVDVSAELHAVLTPEQRRALVDLVTEHMDEK